MRVGKINVFGEMGSDFGKTPLVATKRPEKLCHFSFKNESLTWVEVKVEF